MTWRPRHPPATATAPRRVPPARCPWALRRGASRGGPPEGGLQRGASGGGLSGPSGPEGGTRAIASQWRVAVLHTVSSRFDPWRLYALIEVPKTMQVTLNRPLTVLSHTRRVVRVLLGPVFGSPIRVLGDPRTRVRVPYSGPGGP